VPVADGPATLAVRPEALTIARAEGDGAATVHRVTDYGTHAIVDIALADGVRLKSMAPDARAWTAGMAVELQPRAFALYRDDAAIHRSG
jgi:putative spermidine/putrescine transport system ATP-binding protein